MEQFKLVSIDVGRVRVGVAVCETGCYSARPFATFARANNVAERALVDLLQRSAVEILVVGLPLDEHGNETEQSVATRHFCRRLLRRVTVTIEFIDEYGSSEEAIEKLRSAGKVRSLRDLQVLRQKGSIDRHAAAIILERYLSRARKN